MKRLKVALIGLEGVGEEYLRALGSDEQFELIAVADTDSKRLRRLVEPVGLGGYEDCRQLIVESARAGLDLLFVALEPHQAIEFVELAARHGVGVFHKAPFARNVREGRRLVGAFEEADCPLVVSRLWQFEPAFSRLGKPAVMDADVHTVTATVRTDDEPSGWRGDSARAGGGVLLNGAYEQVDMLVHIFGVPESVYAQSTRAPARGGACTYDTEDAILAMLRFDGRRTGCIAAWRGAPEGHRRIVFVAADRTIELAGKRLTVTHRDSDTVKRRTVQDHRVIASAIGAFGATRREGEQRFESRAREHLSTLAVIEAAYLSAKTGEAESPDRFLGIDD